MNVRRLNKLAKFLDDLPGEEFDFSLEVYEFDAEKKCGSVCCAMGWAPKVFPKLAGWNRHGCLIGPNGRPRDYDQLAAEIFGICLEEAEHLFSPHQSCPWLWAPLDDYATPKQVAESIRDFILWKKEGGKL